MIAALDPISGVENVPEGEADQIREIARLMPRLMEQRYRDGTPFLRGVHPKPHGCARASFTVRPDLPAELQVGVFAHPGVSYEAVVRFSNAAALVGPDVQDVTKDGVTTRQHGSRGMAVKVRGLSGVSLAPDEPGTQDFLMVNSDVFPFANVADYLALTQAQFEHNDKLELVFPAFAQTLAAGGGGLRARKAGEISGTIQRTATANPLHSSYFSAAPFLFGPDRVMKYAVMPSPAIPVTHDGPLPASLDTENYLRAALAESLRNSAATFDFAVQVRPPSPAAHVEDVTEAWAASDVEFQSVATIVIPTQQIDGPDATVGCESLFWTPWHSLPEHRPVGGINRLRLAVYEASISRRRQGAV